MAKEPHRDLRAMKGLCRFILGDRVFRGKGLYGYISGERSFLYRE